MQCEDLIQEYDQASASFGTTTLSIVPQRASFSTCDEILRDFGKSTNHPTATSQSSNALLPMACIKSSRAMSEHLLGNLEVPPSMLDALRVKSGSLRDSDKDEKLADLPRQRWSSVRVKGGSTKSLLLENGGPAQAQLKGTKEVHKFLSVV